MIDRLEAMLAQGHDNALLRYSLGVAWEKEGDSEKAIDHLQHAVQHNPDYSAAWSLLGKLLLETHKPAAALRVLTTGIDAANANGDVQASKVMQVFLKRAKKALQNDDQE